MFLTNRQWKSVFPATGVLHVGCELMLASNNEITGCLSQFDLFFFIFAIILDVFEKNSGKLLKSLKYGAK